MPKAAIRWRPPSRPAGVRYTDGVIQLNMTDLSSAGFGTPWGMTRNWTNGASYIISGSLLGNGIVASQMPYLQSYSTGSALTLVTSGTNVRFFDLSGSVYNERYFLTDKLVPNTSTHDFTLVDGSAKVLKFYDFSSNNPTLQQGTFESLTDLLDAKWPRHGRRPNHVLRQSGQDHLDQGCRRLHKLFCL
jgi:hypothetical protein